jgi:tetratricopeptide (TPR) repeat protein
VRPDTLIVRRLLTGTLGAAAVIGGFAVVSAWRARPSFAIEPPAAIAPAIARLDAPAALIGIDRNIGELNARAESPQGDMVDRERLSSAYLSRFKLTGDWADLAEARRQADAGFGLVPGGHGPFLMRATVAMTAHRIAAAEDDLARVDAFVVPDLETRSEAPALHGDIAMARGDLPEAERWYAKAAMLQKWPGLYWRFGNIASIRGDFVLADRYFRAADGLNRTPSPSFRADSLLRQGELMLAQGRWPEARRLFAEANRLFPGWWRAEMRVAQMQALDGNVTAAIAAFESVAERTGAPEAMDILAGLYRSRGDSAKAHLWSARAGTVWATRLAVLPEAAWAHVVEHELSFGSPKRALDFARRNATNRPYAPSRILLAKALLANGQTDAAAKELDVAERQGFVSSELHLTRAEVLAAKGDGDGVAAAQARAVAINPHALDRNPSFAWLDH